MKMKQILIAPKGKVQGVIKAPGSKSITNRALIISSLCKGITTLKGAVYCDDSRHMIKALRQLGVKIDIKHFKDKGTIKVYGTNCKFKVPNKELLVGNAGTAMRFLLTLSAFVEGDTVITGIDRMMENRPRAALEDGLRQLGVEIEDKEGEKKIIVRGKGFLNGGEIVVDGSESSQFISSILLCAPYANGKIIIKTKADVVSKPYLDITLKMMADFGVEVEIEKSYSKFVISPDSKYRSPKNYHIEGDCSNASYFWGAAAISEGKIKVTNINPNTKQGDIQFVDYLEKMGCKVKRFVNAVEIVGNGLKGIDVDMNDTPDVAQTLAIVALFANGKTEISNVHNLRVKESNRIEDFINELKKIGADVKAKKDGFVINALNGGKTRKTILCTHDDHRMAMSFSLLGLKNPIIIENPDCVRKTFPNFFKEFKKVASVR